MRLLLDTHVLLWWLSNDPTLKAPARNVIASPETEVFVSAASAWEISIEKAIGKLRAPDNLPELIRRHEFRELPISVEHAQDAGALPAHHGDPFDRMLIAQARREQLALASRDPRFRNYDVDILEA